MIDIPNLFQNSHKIKSTVIEKDIIPNIPIIPNGPGNNNGFSPKIMKYFVTSIVIYPKMFRQLIILEMKLLGLGQSTVILDPTFMPDHKT